MNDTEEIKILLRKSIETLRISVDVIADSEARISHVNNMIEKLTSILDRIEETYEHHIRNVTTARDNVVLQNTELIKQNQKLIVMIERRDKKIRELIDRIDGKDSEFKKYLMDLAKTHRGPIAQVNTK